MPALVTLPLFQNQYTHGRAEAGGLANCAARSPAISDVTDSASNRTIDNFTFIDQNRTAASAAIGDAVRFRRRSDAVVFIVNRNAGHFKDALRRNHHLFRW